jgi:hypothetical protein
MLCVCGLAPRKGWVVRLWRMRCDNWDQSLPSRLRVWISVRIYGVWRVTHVMAYGAGTGRMAIELDRQGRRVL